MNSLESINYYLLADDDVVWVGDSNAVVNQIAVGQFVEFPDSRRFLIKGVEHSASGLKAYGVFISFHEMLALIRAR